MDYQLFPYFALLAAILLIRMIVFLWDRREQPGAGKLVTLMAVTVGWVFFDILQLVDFNPERKLLWVELKYIFITSAPVLWLMFAVDYHDHAEWLRRPRPVLLILIPLVTIALVFTNHWHNLIWSRVDVILVGSYLALVFTHGPFFWIAWGYLLILLLAGLVILGLDTVNKAPVYRWQVAWITAGLALIGAVNLVYVAHLVPWLQKDYTSVAAAVGLVVFTFVITRLNLFDVLPLSRSTLFDLIDVGVLAVNLQDRVIDINPAGRTLFGLQQTPQLISKPLKEIFPAYYELIESLSRSGKVQTELLAQINPPVYLEFKASPLVDRRGRLRGRLFLVRDISQAKFTEMAEKENRDLAEALRNTAQLLNSSLDIEDVLDRILENIKKVMQCESANLMLIEGERAKTVRRLGSSAPEVYLEVKETPSMVWMVEHCLPLVIPDVNLDANWVNHSSSAWIQSYAAAPIAIAGEVIGFINLDSLIKGYYTQQHADRLKIFADQAAIAIQNARLFSRVAEIATQDDVTGLNNRRAFFTQAVREMSRAVRYAKPLSAIMIDLDGFKQVNDTCGHLTGDRVLGWVGEILRSELRDEDLIGRYGGDEFSVLLPETDLPEALEVAERLRAKIAAIDVPVSGEPIQVTASLGLAQLFPGFMTLTELLSQADAALYAAKNNGRNKVEVYGRNQLQAN